MLLLLLPGPGRLIQSGAGIRDREVPDPDWIGNLNDPSRIKGVLP